MAVGMRLGGSFLAVGMHPFGIWKAQLWLLGSSLLASPFLLLEYSFFVEGSLYVFGNLPFCVWNVLSWRLAGAFWRLECSSGAWKAPTGNASLAYGKAPLAS